MTTEEIKRRADEWRGDTTKIHKAIIEFADRHFEAGFRVGFIQGSGEPSVEQALRSDTKLGEAMDRAEDLMRKPVEMPGKFPAHAGDTKLHPFPANRGGDRFVSEHRPDCLIWTGEDCNCKNHPIVELWTHGRGISAFETKGTKIMQAQVNTEDHHLLMSCHDRLYREGFNVSIRCPMLESITHPAGVSAEPTSSPWIGKCALCGRKCDDPQGVDKDGRQWVWWSSSTSNVPMLCPDCPHPPGCFHPNYVG